MNLILETDRPIPRMLSAMLLLPVLRILATPCQASSATTQKQVTWLARQTLTAIEAAMMNSDSHAHSQVRLCCMHCNRPQMVVCISVFCLHRRPAKSPGLPSRLLFFLPPSTGLLGGRTFILVLKKIQFWYLIFFSDFTFIFCVDSLSDNRLAAACN